MNRLLIRPHRHSDECFVSYLIRVSEQNGFQHIGHLFQRTDLPWKNLRIPAHQIITGEYDIKPNFSQLGLDYTYPRTAHLQIVPSAALYHQDLRQSFESMSRMPRRGRIFFRPLEPHYLYSLYQTQTAIARLRTAFDQFIEINWPNAIQPHGLTRISLSSGERPLTIQKKAQRLLECREPRIHSLIAQGKITLHKFKSKAYFNREEAESLAKLYQDNWSMAQAVIETELSRYQPKLLLDAGLGDDFQHRQPRQHSQNITLRVTI